MSEDDILAIIARHTCEILPRLRGHPFKGSDSMRELGANSIDRSEITMMTLESLSLSIPLVETVKAQNIGELAALLHAKLELA